MSTNMKDNWAKARNDVGNVNLVINLIKKGMYSLARGKRNMDYPFKLEGFQRRRSTRGEAIIESDLLSNPKRPKRCIVKTKGIRKEVEFKTNAAGLGNKRKGNIIVDLFGLDNLGSPVAGEVKVTDRNPWYAVVECVAQVALLRSDRQHLKSWLQKTLGKNIRGSGAWGMVIAPKNYWRKKEIKSARRLIEKLRKQTKIRVCCVSYEKSKKTSFREIGLTVMFGQPPSTRQKK